MLVEKEPKVFPGDLVKISQHSKLIGIIVSIKLSDLPSLSFGMFGYIASVLWNDGAITKVNCRHLENVKARKSVRS